MRKPQLAVNSALNLINVPLYMKGELFANYILSSQDVIIQSSVFNKRGASHLRRIVS